MSATEMAREMSVIMPGWRFFSSGTAICKNGTPPYANTSVPNSAGMYFEPGNNGALK
jgi:hypothetical protein